MHLYNYIGTEHILWGLAKEGGGIAANVLLSSGDTDRVMEKIITIIGKGDGNAPMSYTPEQRGFGIVI